ncbi:MAG: bifunctional 4-hydroxy-2-oxoglutarate aldolase/2-dehydro-3-deoxy-phosphogluconate aldolase [Ktedonobacterales bacterium]
MIPREMVAMMARRRLVAEVRTETAVQALGVVDALAAAGITTVEISLTIPGAAEILSHLATRQDVLVGAGAVLDQRQATEAISAGARFIASPIFAPEILPAARDAGVACILGALTPSEIIAAQRAGAEMVKLFPAEALGGPMYIRALLRQLTHVSLQVSGGFAAEHFGEYLQLPVRTIAIGTLLTPTTLVERAAWQAITNRARAFVEYANNPHAYAARFLAMMGAAPRPQAPVGPGNPNIYAVPTMPISEGMIGPAIGLPSTPPPASPSAGRYANAADAQGEGSGSGQNFRPWDSRPVEQGDDEDWLR